MRHWEIIYFPLTSISTDVRLFRWLAKFVMKNDWYAGLRSVNHTNRSQREVSPVQSKNCHPRETRMSGGKRFADAESLEFPLTFGQTRRIMFKDRFSRLVDFNWAIIEWPVFYGFPWSNFHRFLRRSLINRGRRGFRLIYFWNLSKSVTSENVKRHLIFREAKRFLTANTSRWRENSIFFGVVQGKLKVQHTDCLFSTTPNFLFCLRDL